MKKSKIPTGHARGKERHLFDEAMMETMDILSDPKAMKVLRAAKAGKLSYKKLDLDDHGLGL